MEQLEHEGPEERRAIAAAAKVAKTSIIQRASRRFGAGFTGFMGPSWEPA